MNGPALASTRWAAPLRRLAYSARAVRRPASRRISEEERKRHMKTSTTDQIRGAHHELKGDVPAKGGQATNNRNRGAEGKNEKPTGRIKTMIGDIKRAFER